MLGNYANEFHAMIQLFPQGLMFTEVKAEAHALGKYPKRLNRRK